MAFLVAVLIMSGAVPRAWAARPPAPRSHSSAAGASATSTAAALIKRASDLLEWGRYKEARTLLAQSVAQPAYRNNAQLLAYYGHVLVKFNDLKDAMNVTERAVKLDPDCASCHLYHFEAMAQHAKTLSHFHALIELPKLRSELETATRLNPQMDNVQWGWVDFEMGLPKALGGSVSTAEQHADLLLKIDPVDGHLARARIAEDQNNPAEALAEYRAAASVSPGDPRGVFALGKALYESGHHEQAAVYLSRALALNGKSALYAAYKAANLVYLHQLDDAHALLQRWQQEHPDCQLGNYLVASALKDIGQDFTWARQLLASYMTVAPEPGQPSHADARMLMAALG